MVSADVYFLTSSLNVSKHSVRCFKQIWKVGKVGKVGIIGKVGKVGRVGRVGRYVQLGR